MPILLGILSSLGIGISDFFGRFATRRANATSTVLTALVTGTAAAVALTTVVSSTATTRDMTLGALSGLGIGFALMLMYRGMAVSSTALVSPIVAVFVALVPLAWDVARGANLSGVTVVGIIVALMGIVATTASPDVAGDVRTGLLLALAAGVLFGVAMTFVGETGLDSGVWPAVSQRATAWAALAAYAISAPMPLILPRKLLHIGVLSGIAGTVGMAAFIAGAQRGSLGEVAVASSMFPAVTAILAAVFDDEVLRWWHMMGIAAVLVGVALIAGG
jgi:drug/metabolite transporter (DMT)-like permease